MKRPLRPLLSLGTCALIPALLTAQPDSWTQRTGPGANSQGVAFSIDGTGYFLKPGVSPAHATLWAYDPNSDAWSPRSSFPTARRWAAAFVVAGKGYVTCGVDSVSDVNDLWEYDPIGDGWTRKADLPGLPRVAPIAFSLNGKGYVGGGQGIDEGNDLYAYDPGSDSWTARASMNAGSTGSGVFCVGGRAYVSFTTGTFQAYDPVLDAWIPRAPMPSPPGGAFRLWPYTFTIGGRGFIGGGTQNYIDYYHDLLEYDPVMDGWTARADLSAFEGAYEFSMGIGDRGYVGLPSGELWAYEPVPDLVCDVVQTFYCAGSQIGFTCHILGAIYGPDNVFTVQLSDAAGSFSPPVAIGTSTLTSTGVMFGTIPANTPPGTGYRIRVVSDHPALTGPANAANITVVAPVEYFHDVDGDGFGDPDDHTFSCSGAPPGYVTNATDDCPTLFGLVGYACNDNDPATDDDRIADDCTCKGVYHYTLAMNTRQHASELSWEVLEEGTQNVVLSGPSTPYLDNSFVNEPLALRGAGCWELRVHSSGGHGMGDGGYVLLDPNNAPVIDDDANGDFGALSTIGHGSGFCTPEGTDRLDDASCDHGDWHIDEVMRARTNAAVSAQFGVGDQTDDGYQFWFFDPNGSYSRRIFRDHASSGGNGSPSATRATKLQLSTIISVPLPYDVLLNVRVRSRVNGVYAPFGPCCRFTLVHPSECPLTQLDDREPHQSCGNSFTLAGSDRAWAKVVTRVLPGGGVQAANKYQFEWSIPGEGYVRLIASNNAALILNTWSTLPLTPCTWYDVRVRASFNNGVDWCPWGPSCSVFIRGSNCGKSIGTGDQDAVDPGSRIVLFPNPGDGDRLSMRLQGLAAVDGTARLTVRDPAGRSLWTGTCGIVDGSASTELTFGRTLAAGIYSLEVLVGDERVVRGFVVR